MVRVDVDAVQKDRILHVVPDDLDAEVVDEPCGVEIDVLALPNERGYDRRGDPRRVFSRIEVGVVRFVGELNLHLESLGGLLEVEVEPQIAHLGIEVRELDNVVDLGQAVFGFKGGPRLLEVEFAAQVDRVVPRRSEEVEIEDERLEHGGRKHNDHDAFGKVHEGSLVRMRIVAHERSDLFPSAWHKRIRLYAICTGDTMTNAG